MEIAKEFVKNIHKSIPIYIKQHYIVWNITQQAEELTTVF